MYVQLKRQVALDGKVYPAGLHTLPDSLSKHWFFKALVKDGSAVLKTTDKPEPQRPLSEMAPKLPAKIVLNGSNAVAPNLKEVDSEPDLKEVDDEDPEKDDASDESAESDSDDESDADEGFLDEEEADKAPHVDHVKKKKTKKTKKRK